MTGQPEASSPIPEEIRARLARATIRLSGPVGHPMVASFFDQLLPVLEIDGAILVELFTDGGDAEIGRRLAEEVRLLRQQHGRDMWFLGKTLVASAGVTIMAAFPKDKRWLTREALIGFQGDGLGHVTRAAMSAPSSALPRRRALCTN